MKWVRPEISDKSQLRPLASFDPDECESISRVYLSPETVVERSLKSASVHDFVANGVSFASTSGSELEFTDGKFSRCDFANTDFQQSSFERVVFEECRFIGVDLSNTGIRDVLFVECSLPISHFRGARLSRVQFQSCDLSESNSQGASIRSSRFFRSSLRSVEFSHCKFDSAEFDSCDHVDLVKGFDYLTNITVSHDVLIQIAPLLALSRGIAVAEHSG